MKLSRITDKKVSVLATDIFNNKVFTSNHIRPRDHHLFGQIFMALGLMNKEQIGKLDEDPPGMFYEYYEKALGRSINGYPMFTSVHMLTVEDAVKVWEKHAEIQKAVEQITGITTEEKRESDKVLHKAQPPI